MAEVHSLTYCELQRKQHAELLFPDLLSHQNNKKLAGLAVEFFSEIVTLKRICKLQLLVLKENIAPTPVKQILFQLNDNTNLSFCIRNKTGSLLAEHASIPSLSQVFHYDGIMLLTILTGLFKDN